MACEDCKLCKKSTEGGTACLELFVQYAGMETPRSISTGWFSRCPWPEKMEKRKIVFKAWINESVNIQDAINSMLPAAYHTEDMAYVTLIKERAKIIRECAQKIIDMQPVEA